MSKDCRSRTCSVPSCGRRHNRLLHSELPKKETTKNVSDATTAVATNITQGGLPVVRIKLTNRDLSLNVLAMCDSGSSISFVDKSVVPKLQLRGRIAALSVAGIHGSQDVKTEIVPIAFSAWEVSTIDNSAVLRTRKTEIGWPHCGAARVERPLPTSEELARSELQSKGCSSDSWTRLLRHSSPFWIQEVRRQSCNMGSEIKDWLGFKWTSTSEASSNSCDHSNFNCRRQISKPVE